MAQAFAQGQLEEKLKRAHYRYCARIFLVSRPQS